MLKRHKNRKNRFMAGSTLLQSDPHRHLVGDVKICSHELQSVHVIPKLLSNFCIYVHCLRNSGMQLISSLVLNKSHDFFLFNQLQRGPLRSHRLDVRLPMNCVDFARSQKNAREPPSHRVNLHCFHDMARSANGGSSSTVPR
jgi:hypothetical protein